MKSKMCLQKEIDILKVSDKLITKLKENNINIVNDLWILKRSDLKNKGFLNDEINLIIIQLQLLGLDLNKKKY